jgi:hypothetical protein
MSSHRNPFRGGPRRLESPFLDAELVAREADDPQIPELVAPSSGTPFLDAQVADGDVSDDAMTAGEGGHADDVPGQDTELTESEYDEESPFLDAPVTGPPDYEAYQYESNGGNTDAGEDAESAGDWSLEGEQDLDGETIEEESGLFDPAMLNDELQLGASDAEFDDPEGYETNGAAGEGFDEAEIITFEDESDLGADEGEIVTLNEEFYEEGENPGAVSRVQARILWPALGFPAVIAPTAKPSDHVLRDGDATRCVTVLLLTNRKALSKAEAAAGLRVVAWGKRGRRHIASGQPGSFAETDLVVRNDSVGPALTEKGHSDEFGQHVRFGANGDGENGITVMLAKAVLDFYRGQGLAYLHEIRISERASRRLAEGQYQLFWNNATAAENSSSDEMHLLLSRFATPRRAALAKAWPKHAKYLIDEYEYEYGGLHAPYAAKAPKRRAELLHPLFVQRKPDTNLRIGHVTDTHVHVRADVYEHNLRQANAHGGYNNFNASFVRVYDHARKDSDVILLTGDLIDYGRGHWGTREAGRLEVDGFYHVDRNWFLFSYLLASGNAYTRPVYTILGNHDWRLNPYPPFAPGAPDPKSLIHTHARIKTAAQEKLLATAHGKGFRRGFSYLAKAETAFQLLREKTKDSLLALAQLLGQTRDLDKKGIPTETTIASVEWYLLSINPFLDYSVVLPGKQRLLMLDWAEDEHVLFPLVRNGKELPYDAFAPGGATGPGPKASKCLTPLQQRMVKEFADAPGRAKVIGIHAPPIGPYGDWKDPDLANGRKIYADPRRARGPTNYATKLPGKDPKKWNGHPIFAIRPKGGAFGMEADCGSFVRARSWFITTLADPRHWVRLVMAGHIHRNNLLMVYPGAKGSGAAVEGELLVRSLKPTQGVIAPRGPLYVNTTCAGPRGGSYTREPTASEKDHGGLSMAPGYCHAELASNGVIRNVVFRAAGAPTHPVTPIREIAELAEETTLVPV